MNLPQGMQYIECKVGYNHFWVANRDKWPEDKRFVYIERIEVLSTTNEHMVVLTVPEYWTHMTDDDVFAAEAKRKAFRAEMERRRHDKYVLDWRYGLEAKMKRRMRFKNPIKAIERLDARINYLVRYWNAYGCHQYIANMITHFNGLRESLTKYRIDQEELAREAFKPSRVEYSLSCQ